MMITDILSSGQIDFHHIGLELKIPYESLLLFLHTSFFILNVPDARHVQVYQCQLTFCLELIAAWRLANAIESCKS